MSRVVSDIVIKDGVLHVTRTQDVEPYLDINKAMQNAPQSRWLKGFHHIATIPNVILEKWMTEEGAPVLSMTKEEFGRFIRRKLRDPDYRYLKTTDKKV